MRKWLIGIVALVAIGLAFFAYRWMAHNVLYTSDAYIDANVVPISAEVSGHIKNVYVLDNQDVEEGDPLFQVDPDPYLYVVKQKEGALAQSIKDQQQLIQQVEMTRALIEMRRNELNISIDHWERAQPLLQEDFMSQQQGFNIYYTMKRNEAAVAEAEYQLAEIEAELGPPDEPFARTLIAEGELEEARYNLTRTLIIAPTTGRVTNFYVRPGQFVEPGIGLFALVDTSTWWITARFKDIALADIKPGARTRIWIDMYWGHLFEGKVESVGYGVNRHQASSDAAPSTLPYLEQTEFWIRLSQRFPVRIEVTERDPNRPLRVGANARIFISHEDSK